MVQFNGTPLWYQEEDLAFMQSRMVRPGRCILGHKTGLGKTFLSLYGATRRDDQRILVIGTKKSAAIWINEIPRWTSYTATQITTKTKNRDQVWKDACRSPSGIYLVTYQLLQRLIGKIPGNQKKIRASMLPWDLVVCDEAHKMLRGHKTQTFEMLKCIPSKHMNILSATLASRGPQDLWSSLHLLHPDFFSSYWRFVSQHCHVFKTEYGQEIGGVKDSKYTKEILRKYYIGRGNEVRKQMAPIRQTIELEMDDDQAKSYWKLLDDMLLELDSGEVLIASSKLALNNKLRQMALCPRMFDPTLPLGAGIDYILEEIEEEPHAVIFTPQKAYIRVLAAELVAAGYDVTVLQGGMEAEEVNTAIARWKKVKGVCLCTIASAESFALDTVNVAYFLGAEYDPTLNIQAEGRLQRIDSADIGITIRYIIIKDTVEEGVKDIINGKVANVSRFFDTYIQAARAKSLAPNNG